MMALACTTVYIDINDARLFVLEQKAGLSRYVYVQRHCCSSRSSLRPLLQAQLNFVFQARALRTARTT